MYFNVYINSTQNFQQKRQFIEKFDENRSKVNLNVQSEEFDETNYIGLTSNHNSAEHKFYFTKFQNHFLQTNKENEINILLLGETGVGKSTFINAFANYLTFKTLDDAEKNELVYLIPFRFTITDENYHLVYVKIGQYVNESFEPGHSATQSCKAYLFPYENYQIRLIAHLELLIHEVLMLIKKIIM